MTPTSPAPPRSLPTIQEDIAWLGITVDRLEKQSARMARYDGVRDELKSKGLLYACYETAEELDYKRKRQMALGKPPIYDRTGLNLSDEERKALEAEGRKPHWRFKLTGKRVDMERPLQGRSKPLIPHRNPTRC
jgi:glutamyl-tRNA synthetase